MALGPMLKHPIVVNEIVKSESAKMFNLNADE